MVSHKTISKLFIVSVFIFFMVNTSSLGSYQDSLSGNSRQDPVPHVFGEMGENQWYVTAVTVSFDFEPAKVKEIQYCLEGIWYIYSDPFNVVEDGVYYITWIWIETSGRPHDGLPFEFKIDKSPPTIEISRKSGGKNKFIFIADANDTVSAIWRVEFYLDEVLNQTDIELPYEYSWTGKEKQTVYAICYNYAGFSTKSNTLDTSPRLRFRNLHFMHRFFILIQVLLIKFH